ncbi:MAG: KpsF/GutQ family sugar-phosphate isomerase [Candidatus Omnitrophota bacterium]|nr:KpsF/GutQ family sugar-phosphate isomerase [Candidatus Omnitrophota bacterium]MDZ4242560.1 KpsF/GutQ family sugar-phosphate isomerase [Candidatus Omnitrophota bacterium]
MSLEEAKHVISIEAQAVKDLARRLDARFLKAVDLIVKCEGRVITTGMGKTGIIGRKIASTFSSTGTPSIWVHSAEAVHGDLGQVTRRDVLMVLSNSGETEETTRLLPLIKKIGCKTIALTGNVKSSLGRFSDVALDVGVKTEGCPLGLAPMASTTVMLVLGDALAACLILRKGFRKEDFAFYHPAGALGRRLLLKVEDIMRKGGDYAAVGEGMAVKDVLFSITRARCGSACVVDGKRRLTGIFTDGDLRRHLKTDKDLLGKKVSSVMTRKPTAIGRDKLAVEAFNLLKDRKIDELPVVDSSGRCVGLLDIQDLLKAGLF